MIKARVLSTNLSAKPDAPIEVNMEMWVFDNGSISCPGEVVIMTEEEYKALDSVSDVLRKLLLDEREKTRKLKEKNRDLEEQLAQETDQLDIHPDGTFVFKKKRVLELEKEVEKLKEENKDLKNKGDEFSLKITGGLFYKED